MIFGHLRQVHAVQALSDDVALRQLRVRHEIGSFGQALHQRFGCVGLLLGGFSAGFLFDRLRPHWRTIHSGGNLGLSLLHLLPLVEFFGRTFWRREDVGLD
jgi:hypothetical protein